MNQPRNTGRGQGIEANIGVLFLAAFPLFLWLFQGSVVVLVSAVLQLGLLAAALRLISRGQEVARAYNASRVAHRPRLPRKLLGSGLIGLVVLILAGHQFATLTMPLICGLVATGLSVLAFGMDPLVHKGLDDPRELRRQHDAAMMTEVETTLAEAVSRVAGLDDPELTRSTAAARATIVSLMRGAAPDDEQFERLRKPLLKAAELMTAEVLRLERACEDGDFGFASRRYIAKTRVLVKSFEDLVLKGGLQSGRDAFDLEADMLLQRMRHDSAA